ncbi:MAG TPA: pirin family protein [Pyrinomonadaceae bacterium]|nr:pirin family protein [Pyrinomonadaceae bacterium]
MVHTKVAAKPCEASDFRGSVFERFPARETSLGTLKIIRALPIRQKRLVGAWCFLDRFGPLSFTEAKPMDVAPHPHIGLQTVSWLLQGEIVHNDSLGNESLLRPGGVNVMTSGGGIAHAEETPRKNSGLLNGVQLWIALPDAYRNVQASFQHIDEVPIIEQAGGMVSVFAGSMPGCSSPAKHFSQILGADIALHATASLELPLDTSFEHAALLITGDAEIDGQSLEAMNLYYLGTNRSSVEFKSRDGGHVLLLGGPPFPEKILMWWNFVARTSEEIAQAQTDWQSHQRFGEVKYRGPRLDAPPLRRFAPPNPAS